MSNFEKLSQKEIMQITKALMREYKISQSEAFAFLVEQAMKECGDALRALPKEIKKGMDAVTTCIESCERGFDVTTIDPYIRQVAKTEPHLKITLVQGFDLARQCAECRRAAGY